MSDETTTAEMIEFLESRAAIAMVSSVEADGTRDEMWVKRAERWKAIAARLAELQAENDELKNPTFGIENGKSVFAKAYLLDARPANVRYVIYTPCIYSYGNSCVAAKESEAAMHRSDTERFNKQ